MKAHRLMWPAFAAAAAVVLASMAWVTAAVLRLDAAEIEARRRAQLEENVRLALWRMDSALAPLIAAEHARPAGAFAAAESAPLPGTDSRFIAGYVRFTAGGAVPVGAIPSPIAPGEHPAPLRSVTYGELLAALPPPAAAPVVEPGVVAQAPPPPKGGKGARSYQEYQARATNTQQQVEVQSNINRGAYDLGPADVAAGAMRPLWAGEELVFARRVADGRREAVQACLVDWPAVRQWLVRSVNDLLPEARLTPVSAVDPAAEADARLLASVPVRLEPGPLPAPADAAAAAAASPLRASLAIAWACVLAAVAAVGLMLAGVASLSERRGAFVSAVTHELRTPLTTLRMYTEMLAEGMVADEGQRRSYLQTLRAEADRLGHLVENVLAYSRLERNRAGYELSIMTIAEATNRSAERLAERARQAGMALRVAVPADVASARVRTNALALEQILFNLVDNACKYASGVADRTIDFTASAADGIIRLRVRDHGPGLPAAGGRRLFRPFRKSVQEAANTAPGLGLGLALSRRLARSMGGDLAIDRTVTDGAAFVVTVPRA